MKCHNRVINLTYFEHNLPKHKSAEEVDEWHRALGRAVAYGLQREAEEDTVQFVHITLDRDADMLAVYYKALPAYTMVAGYHGGHLADIDGALGKLKTSSEELGKPFVIGAVLSNGKYGFHS